MFFYNDYITDFFKTQEYIWQFVKKQNKYLDKK